VLTHFPFHVSFGYAGHDRQWVETWTANAHLPDAVRVTVRDAESGVVLAVSTAALMKVTAPPPSPDAAAAGAAPGQAPNPSDASAQGGTAPAGAPPAPAASP
jgi:general secretion pathway protein J